MYIFELVKLFQFSCNFSLPFTTQFHCFCFISKKTGDNPEKKKEVNTKYVIQVQHTSFLIRISSSIEMHEVKLSHIQFRLGLTPVSAMDERRTEDEIIF